MATAFCIYSETDNSLNFYKRESVPSVGDTFENKIVTKIWTGFETKKYTTSSHPNWYSDNTIKSVVSVNFVDTISPLYLDGWFRSGLNIETMNLANLDTSQCKTMTHTFRDCSSLTSLDVSGFNTSIVTNMTCLFYNCNNLQTLDVSNFNTQSVTNMSFMFYGLLQCDIIGLQSFNTAAVTTMQSMFYKCCSIKNFDLSSWDTGKVTHMGWMFAFGAGLTLNMAGWNTSKVKTMTSMFTQAYFTYLDCSTFTFESLTNANSMFLGCEMLRTIVASHDWTDSFTDSMDVWWMFENCYSLMGDVSYFDLVDPDKPLEETYPYMSGIYATTKGGYLTMKYEEPEGGEDYVDNSSYLVLGSTLTDIANKMRTITGTPTKIALKNFGKVLERQVNSAEIAAVSFKDNIFDGGDVAEVGYVHFINGNFNHTYRNISRFMILPSVINGSVITFTDLVSLADGNGALVCDGNATQVDEHSFVVNGNCTIEIVNKTDVVEEPVMMMSRRVVVSKPLVPHSDIINLDE